jgi:hypothetical protein
MNTNSKFRIRKNVKGLWVIYKGKRKIAACVDEYDAYHYVQNKAGFLNLIAQRIGA